MANEKNTPETDTTVTPVDNADTARVQVGATVAADVRDKLADTIWDLGRDGGCRTVSDVVRLAIGEFLVKHGKLTADEAANL